MTSARHNPPPSGRDGRDVEHTRRRRRAIGGEWQDDLRQYVVLKKGALVAEAWGAIEPPGCPLRELSQAVAVLYVEQPAVRHPGVPEELRAAFVERLRISGIWNALGEAQFLTEALNECAVNPEYSEGRLTYRLSTPNLCEGGAEPATPALPDFWMEWRYRVTHLPGRTWTSWYADVFDVRDRENPRFYIVDAEKKPVDYPGVPALEGEEYPWRRQNGTPYIPVSLRHSQQFPQALFSPWVKSETYSSSLDAALRQAAIGQCFVNIGWPSAYVIDAQPMGYQTVKDSDGNEVARQIAATPGHILQFASIEDGRTPQIGVLNMQADLPAMQQAYSDFLAGIAAAWGIRGDELWRADGRSGAALTLSEGARRRMQAARAPVYRDADERLLGMIASMLAQYEPETFGDLPDYGWQIDYGISPLSPQERAAIIAEADALYDKGVISKAEYRARITGEPLVIAERAVRSIAAGSPPQPPVNGAAP